ncbi:MAG: bifunctional diguanylate cyclase/phosphodiesterase [Deltaproteobacteria bacterium]
MDPLLKLLRDNAALKPAQLAALLGALPLMLPFGRRVDALAFFVFGAITLACWVLSRRWPRAGTLVHLSAMFPYWAVYSATVGGLPNRLDASAVAFASLLVFPTLTLVATEGLYGLGISASFVIAALVVRWPDLPPRLEGLFVYSTGVMVGFVFRRVVVDFEATADRMRAAAHEDELTSLGNRRGLRHQVRQLLSDGETRGVLVLLDIDRFRTVNDAFGHSAGDALLSAVARRISDVANGGDLVARVGGNEFAVVSRAVRGEADATRFVHSLLAALAGPFEIMGRPLNVKASAGVALWPEHGREADPLLHHASAALAHARRDGRLAVLTPGAEDSALLRGSLELEIPRAVREGEFVLHYQPVYDLATDEVVGAEALVRWNHRRRGLLPPGTFIGLAEDSGQIVAVDRWVLHEVARQLRAWSDAGWGGWLALNLSAASLADPDLPEDMERALNEAGVTPDRIILEVTETAAMRNPGAGIEFLKGLERRGIKVSIDDFGTGYSSFAYLQSLPASHLKLDRSYVSGIGINERDEQLVEVLLELAERWGLTVVAEGIERTQQLRWLAARGCKLGQGFLLARPMPALDFQAACGRTVQVSAVGLDPDVSGTTARTTDDSAQAVLAGESIEPS